MKKLLGIIVLGLLWCALNQALRNLRRDKLKNKTLRHESDITKSRRWRPRGEAASKILLL